MSAYVPVGVRAWQRVPPLLLPTRLDYDTAKYLPIRFPLWSRAITCAF